MRRSRLLFPAALAVSLVLVAGTAAAATTPPAPAATPPAAAAASPAADRDRDRIFDDLETALAAGPATARVNVIVTLDGPATPAAIAALQARAGSFAVGRAFTLVDGFAARVSKSQVALLAAAPGVQHVEENDVVTASNGPGNSAFGVAQARLDLPGIDGTGTTAAIVDTGIDGSHADLAGKVVAFADCTAPVAAPVCVATAPFDDHGHGTHVAGTVAGTGAASGGAERGVAPGATLVGVKVLDATGSGSEEGVIAGIQWAVAHRAQYGIRALNMSLGTDGCSDGTDALSQAANEAAAQGITIVASAGNSGPWPCTISSPAAAADAVTVGALGDFSQLGFRLATFSSRGPTLDGRIKPDVVAPGIAVVSAAANTGTGYANLSGTSMAAPFVTGLALLLAQEAPGLTPAQVKAILRGTAVDLGNPGADIDYGAGRVDAYAALRAAGAAINTPPSMPSRTTQTGSLAAGGSVTVPIAVAGPAFPLAATVLLDAWTPGATVTLTLRRPSGAVAMTSALGTRHERAWAASPEAGTWTATLAATGAVSWHLDVSAQLGIGVVAAAAQPALSGGPTARQGVALTGSPGTWTGEAPRFTTLRWLRCDAIGAACVPIPGAVAAAYTPVAADIGARLRFEETVSNWLGFSRGISTSTAVVLAAAPVLEAPPSIGGPAVAGGTVTAAPGTWQSAVPVTTTLAWRLCDATLALCSPAGSGASLPLAPTATGYRVQLVVTASSSGGTATATAATPPVAPAAPAGSGLVAAGVAAGASGGGYATVSALPGDAGRERLEFALRVTTGGTVYGKQLTLRWRQGAQMLVLRTTAVDTGGLFLSPGPGTVARAVFSGPAEVAVVAADGSETPLPGTYRVILDARDVAEPGAGFDRFAVWVGAPDATTFHTAGSTAAPLLLASGNLGFRRS